MPITRGGLAPAVLVNKNTGETVPCMFNPYEYTIAKSNSYEQADTKGKNIPHIRFQQGGAQTLTLRLLFDTMDVGADVRSLTARLWNMMMVDDMRTDPRTGKSEPPHCLFIWGAFTFEAVITQMSEQISLFMPAGTAVRSTIQISLQQVSDAFDILGQNPTSGGGIAPATRMLDSGDRLDLIAFEAYGDSTRWRQIAAANAIQDPLHLRAGQLIIIPPME
jgi:nucleoid-associated protein YgaU